MKTKWLLVTAIGLLFAILVEILVLTPPKTSDDYRFLVCEDALERRQLLLNQIDNDRWLLKPVQAVWQQEYPATEQDIDTYCFSH